MSSAAAKRLLSCLILILLPAASMAAQGDADNEIMKRGAYLARAADCMACHTEVGKEGFSGGYAIASPLGDIVASNISPSIKFGIGAWSEAQFARALRQGISPRGPLYPAMPYTAYAGITDADIHALYTYFMHGVPPVDRAPTNKTRLPFPFNQRILMKSWNMLFAGGTPADPRLVAADGSLRGKYLVEVLGHCSSCHSRRNIFMAETQRRRLGGGEVGGWDAPNITSDPVSGIGGWSRKDLVTYLRNGKVDGKAQAAGGMAEVVEHSTSHLSNADLYAIADYLKKVPAVRDPGQMLPAFAFTQARNVDTESQDRSIDRSPRAMSKGDSVDGERLYVGACASCHQLGGEGTSDHFYPSLTSNTAVGAEKLNNLVMVILHGVHRVTKAGVVAMPAFDTEFSDAQIAAICNYVAAHFGNPKSTITPQAVKNLRGGGNLPQIVRTATISVFAAGMIAGGLLAGAFGISMRGLRRSRKGKFGRGKR